MFDIFNDVIYLEQTSLKKGPLNELSMTEMHTLDAVGLHDKRPMTVVASRLRITVGTLTVAVNKLVKKEYVERKKADYDGRVVLLTLTKKGRVAYRVHQRFHQEMAGRLMADMDETEEAILISALEKLHNYLVGKEEVLT